MGNMERLQVCVGSSNRLALLGICYCLLLDAVVVLAFHPSENELDGGSHSGSHHINTKSPASHLHDEVDIFKLINVSAKDQGVSLVEGPIANYPAYKFRLPYGNVPLANSSNNNVTRAMESSNGFTVVFLYRQQKNNLGTLISVNPPGRLTPWFQVASNSKTGMLSLKYRVDKSDKLRQMDWALPKHFRKSPLAAWTWMSISVDFTTGIVRLDLDCQPSRFESLTPGNDHSRINIPQDALVYFRQEPGRKKKFLGSMQVAKILPYVMQDRLWTCIQIAQNLAPELRKPLL